MIVLDIMAKSPAVCAADTPLADVARAMVDFDCGAIPVLQSRDSPTLVGIVTDRDIVVRLVAENRNPLDATARDAMTANVATVRAHDSLDVATHLMEQHQVRRVPVVDESGAVIGIVSQADIALQAPEQSADLLRELSEDEDVKSDVPMSGDYAG